MASLKSKRNAVRLDLPIAYQGLFKPARYKVYYGGRGSAKSWSVARALVGIAFSRKVRILCAREYQSSITDSVLRLIADQIDLLGLTPFFDVQTRGITCKLTGSEFIFKGLRRNPQEVKSTEGVDICWVEEAQSVTAESWLVLIPTIRKAGSEIWVTFNPFEADDPTYTRFVLNPPPNSIVKKTGFLDNPGFPAELEEERRYMLRTDPDAYEWVWGGHVKTISDAIIFKGKVSVETFETPETARFYHGVDWGFAKDPTVMTRSFIEGRTLFVDAEAWRLEAEFEQLPPLFDRIPTSRKWPIKADSARPETISFIRRQGFMIEAAKKWPGSVEDGIEHLRGFERIVIHERCTHTAEEARLYSYKQDARTKDVLPVIVDKHNHCWDSIRYGLDGFIKARGSASQWAQMVE